MTLPQFTENEQTWIDHCFDSTLYHFVQDPLRRDNPDHIRQAINYRNYNIGSIGARNHEYMHSVFSKLGYCNDGKTTKTEEMNQKIALEKEKAEVWAKQKAKAIGEIDQKIAELKDMKEELINHDLKFNEVVKEKAEKVKEQFQKEIKEDRKESQNLLIRATQEKIDNMNVRELCAEASIRGIKNYSRMKKADLLIAIKESG